MAATANRKWFINWYTEKFQISDANGGEFALPEFHKYETIPLKIAIVEPDLTAKGVEKYRRVAIANLSITVSINDTYDDSSPLAQQAAWTKDQTLNEFQAELGLNTLAMNTFLGSSPVVDAFLEVEIQEGTARTKAIIQAIRIRNSVTQIGASTPTPVDEYFTKAQTTAQFFPRVGEPGTQLVITSPGNIYQRVIGVDDGGAPVDVILPV